MSTINVNNVLPFSGTNVNVNGIEVSTNGTNNVSLGDNSGQSITTGVRNVSLGDLSLTAITVSNDNTAVGNEALKINTGVASTAVGSSALKNATGNQNDAFGFSSLLGLTTGFYNLGLGGNAGRELISGTKNTFVGFAAGSMFTGTGDNNVTLGFQNGFVGTGGNGSNNTFIGTDAAYGYHGGDDNVVVGRFTPIAAIITGNNNIQIGKDAAKASPTTSNSITLGNANHNILRCAVTSITSLSDERDKKEIEELPVGLEFVKGLKPVKFIWDDRNEEGKHDVADFGFIAQDLKASQEEVEMAETLKLVYEENPEKLEASYGKLIPILVKAIQDLNAKVELLENK